MSKLWKSVKKTVKSVFKGIKKVWKKITSSTIGKVVLAAVAIYTGGVLLGAWGSTGPMAGLHGAWTSAGSEMVASGTTSSLGATAGAGTGLAEGAVASEIGSIAAPAAGAGTGLAPGAVATQMGSVAAPTAAEAAATSGMASTGLAAGSAASEIGSLAASGGAAGGTAAASSMAEPSFLSKVMAGLRDTATTNPFKEGAVLGKGGWAQNNPLLAAMSFQGIQGMLSPDEEELLEMKRRQRELGYAGNENLRINVRPRTGG